MLFCIGSDISMMEQLMDHDRALFGRPTLQIRIPPLSPGDIAQLLALDAGDVFDAYLTIGGFPMLAADWGARMTRKRFLARELIDPSSNLIVNGERILAAEFRSETQAREVLEAIGKGERRFEEIRRRTSLQPASLSRSLELLVHGKGVVERLTPYAAPLPRRDPRYLVADPYLRFWLRFVAPYMQEIERGRGDEAVARVTRDWSVYRGAAIEPIVRATIERMLPNDRFGDARRVGSWWDRTGRQLDLVGLPEGGGPARVSFVGSIKWRERAPFDGNDLRALEAALTLVPGVERLDAPRRRVPLRVRRILLTARRAAGAGGAAAGLEAMSAWRKSGGAFELTARAKDRKPCRLSNATREPVPSRYPTVPALPGAVAAAAFSNPAPYRELSLGPPSLRAVTRSLAMIWVGVGLRPKMPLAMISAAVAATCGAAIEVPS